MGKKTKELMDMTNATDQISEADTAEAVKLNRTPDPDGRAIARRLLAACENAQKPTLYALDGYSALFPRVEFKGSNGRLCASIRPPAGGLTPNPLALACGRTLSDENVSVI